jgi:hypothetical protein
MDLNSMTITELKAAVYDQMIIAESTQKNIQILNQTISSKSAEFPTTKEKDNE